MPHTEIDIKEFRNYVLTDFGTSIADQVSADLGSAPVSYARAMEVLQSTIDRHWNKDSRASCRTGSKSDIKMVI